MSSMPFLAVEHRCTGANKSTTTVFSVAGKEAVAGSLDSNELTDKAFCPTPQGWLLVRDRLTTNTYLLDHHGREKILLPPLAIDQDLLIDCSYLQTSSFPIRWYRMMGASDVYKMNFPEQRWCPVGDLGGRAFFVAPFNFGASCLAGDQYGIQQNCVYSLVKCADKSFNVFNVEDGTTQRRNIEAAYVSAARGGALLAPRTR